MGQVIQFVAPAQATAPKLAKRPVIRLVPAEVAQSVREKLEYVAETVAEHEQLPESCRCRICEGYRHLVLNPAVQRILLELFE